ncbi:hypothetical protein SAMN04489807_0219 [Microbacterium hydrocarbonoxydans]|uniref:Uncharacterized protein n=1 Tax=Microbacterium hydrocarbonoxydans TaxID=273678 RepID=A0A1H4IS99_9MICO|nr:hypothetical protein SAMN04489807_0219 [Microbacterium hydrocarbonoxydans]
MRVTEKRRSRIIDTMRELRSCSIAQASTNDFI